MGPTARGELGATLRVWRERRTAGELRRPGPRRVRGLRREELAAAAGVSTDYVVRLEQGRFATPSAAVCRALARALDLSPVEQEHLFVLAGHAPVTATAEDVPASVRRLLAHCDDRPVSVYDATWTRIGWNPLWAETFGDPSHLTGRERNLVWRHFTEQPSRMRHTDAEVAAFEVAVVSDLRAASARCSAEHTVHGLVDDLRERSRRFRSRWDRGDVGCLEQTHKVVEHPEAGALDLDGHVLASRDDEVRVVLHSGRDARTRTRLDGLRR